MSENNKISVIMPVYNAEKYLAESINSILKQTYKNFEFIIINDGSKDNSLKIIEYYAEKDVRIKFITRENKGLIFTLNEGLNVAKGKYIVRMDSDDVAHFKRIEQQYKYLECNEKIDICGTFVNVIGDCSEEYKVKCTSRYNIPLTTENQEEMLLKRGLLCHPSIMFRTELKNKIDIYKETYKTSEDYYFYLRALKKGIKFGIIKEVLLSKREHIMSKSNIERINNMSLKEWIQIRLEYLNNRVNLNRKIIIWGASTAGIIVKDILENVYNCNIINYIDEYKKGELNDIKILKSHQLNNFNNCLIVVASEPGKIEIENFLIKLGYNEYKDYIILV